MMFRYTFLTLLFLFAVRLTAQWESNLGHRPPTSAVATAAAGLPSLDIGNNDEYAGYELLDSLLQKHSLFLAGEDFNYAGFNSKIEFKLLRYMNHKVGLRNYILEMSAAKADLINQYISSSDSTIETLLQSVSKVKYMRLYKNLKRLNEELPDSLKIRVYGIDVERSNALPLVKLSQFLKRDSVPDRLRIAVEAMNGAAQYIIRKGLEDYEREKDGQTDYYESYFYNPTSFSVRATVEEFVKRYDTLKPWFRIWLDSQFQEFDRIVGWFHEYKDWQRYGKTAFEYPWREELMFNRMNALLQEMPKEKFFGQFELCHVGNLRTAEGCGPDNFSGMVNKLRNYSESMGKEVVNIGIFYERELSKSETYMNGVHIGYQEELKTAFAAVRENSAVLVDPHLNEEMKALRNDFDLLILNNNFLLSGDVAEEEVDTAPSGSYESSYERNFNNSRLYMGITATGFTANLNNINAELEAAGRPKIRGISFVGAEIGLASEDRSMARLYVGRAEFQTENYSASYVSLAGGQAIVFTEFMKLAIVSNTSYVVHRIADSTTNTAQTYMVDYKAPKVYVNPAFLYGLSLDAYVEYAPFYAFFSGGFQADLSKKNWRYNGKLTGSRGNLSNTGFLYSIGIGMALPLRWLD